MEGAVTAARSCELSEGIGAEDSSLVLALPPRGRRPPAPPLLDPLPCPPRYVHHEELRCLALRADRPEVRGAPDSLATR